MNKPHAGVHAQQTLLRETYAAEVIGKSVYWMRQARWRGEGPRYYKLGRSVRYRLTDLEEYVQACAVSTDDQPANSPANTPACALDM